MGAILSVKDEDQVKEVGTREQPPTSELCFKVVNSEKKQINTSSGVVSRDDYKQELKIKPFSLGISELPEISYLFFF